MVPAPRLNRTCPILTMAYGLSAFVLTLTGCGIGALAPPSAGDAVTVHGFVHGGQAPVDGAVMQLYAVGTGGNGTGATALITSKVVKSVNGAFTITGDYTCPALVGGVSPPVYLTATGGNPGLAQGTNNPALALVAALGPCNTLYANAANTTVNINEVTTAAAAWALAPFANVAGAANDSSYTSIASSSTNLAGITQAFAIANQLADPTTGASPNASVAAYTSMESTKLYSLADILASCVNSTGADTNCSGLFSDVTPAGGTRPTDIFGAALSVVKNPSNNVANIFMNHVGTSPPFTALSAAPNDWTMTITYSHATGPLTEAYISTIDQQGNLWGTYEYQASILKFSPQLAPLVNVSLYPFDGTTADPSIENTGRKTGVLSIDPSGNLWFASGFSLDINTGQFDNTTGAIFELDTNGNVLSPSTGYTSGGIVNPWTAMADTNGFIWVGNYGYYNDNSGTFHNLGGDVSLLGPTGSAQSPSSGWNVSNGFLPGVINFDANHNAWVTNSRSATLLEFPPLTTGTGLSNPAPGTALAIPSSAFDIVFDTQSQGWFAYGSGIGEINTTGAVTNTTITSGSGLLSAAELAVDASNRIWVYNQNTAANSGTCSGVTLSVFSGGSGLGAPLSNIALGSDIAACSFLGAAGFLIDNAGSILIENGQVQSYYAAPYLYGYDGLIRFVGLATPTKTPNTGPAQVP